MDWQSVIAFAIVGGAGAYLAWRYIRAWTGKATGGCHGGCGGCIHNTACTSNRAAEPAKMPAGSVTAAQRH